MLAYIPYIDPMGYEMKSSSLMFFEYVDRRKDLTREDLCISK